MTDAIIELIRRVERLERALNRTAVGERTPGGGGGAPTDATYLVLSANGSLSGERVATAGANISLTDGGAGGALTVAVDPQGAGSGLDADTVDGVQLSGLVPTGRTINTNPGLLGGGDLSANRTLSLDIAGLTEEATPDGGDMVAIFDDSAAAVRKQSRNSFLSGTTAAQASEAAQGVIELATQAETDAGTDDERAVTPLKLAGYVAQQPLSRACDARLTLTSGTPVTTGDVTGSTLYATPFGGGVITLYDGTNWLGYELAEISVSIPATVWRLFDVYLYEAGGLQLEAVNWNQLTGVISAASNAQPISITDTAHGLTTGDIVVISGVTGNTAANGIWVVTVTGANTFTLNFSQGNGVYAGGGGWWRLNETRATALATQDGILVKAGATDRRYLGTGCTNATTGQGEDSAVRRFLFNYNHRRARRLDVFKSAVHNYATATARRFDSDGTLYTAWIAGAVENDLAAFVATNLENFTANTSQVQAYRNATQLQALAHGVVSRLPLVLTPVTTPAEGFNFLSSITIGNGVDSQWRSTNINGLVWA